MYCTHCGLEMEEQWATFTDTSDEYGGKSHEGMVGYRCKDCDLRYNLEGEEVD